MSRINIPNDEIHALVEDARKLRREGMSEAGISGQLSLSTEDLNELDRRFGGMSNEQIQHLLYVEHELESLREKNQRLQDQLAYAEEVGQGRQL